MSDLAALRAAIKADPLTFPRRILGRTYWSRQGELYRAFHSSDRVAAKGGHSTGKTLAAADFVVEHAALNPGAKVILLGPTFESVRINLFAAVRRAASTARLPIGGTMLAGEWRFRDDWWVRVVGADKPESLHLGHGVAMLVVIDEAVGVEPWAWEPINAALASAGSRLIVLFNPTQATHKTREIADDPTFRVVTLNCEEHPNVVSGSDVYAGAVTRAWVDGFRERVRKGLATEDEYASRVQGEFPSGASDALVTAQDLEKSASVDMPDVRRLGLDVARFGSDRNVLVFVDERRRAIVVDEWAGMDLMFTAGRLMRAVRELGVDPGMTFVDSCGVGGGVVDRCREAGVYVVGVDAGAGPTGRWAEVVGRETTFANRRAELYWTLRCICKSFAVNVPRDLWADLGMIRVRYQGSKIKIEGKDEMRKQHGRSPDRADALALCFAEPSTSGVGIELWD